MPPIRRVVPSRWMPLKLMTLCLLALLGAAEVRAENSVLVDQTDLTFEPYSIYVAVPKAYARCGPADDYYRTDPLRQGQELEVFAETDDGWLGIRPAQGKLLLGAGRDGGEKQRPSQWGHYRRPNRRLDWNASGTGTDLSMAGAVGRGRARHRHWQE